jgi:fatty-acid desaturase
MAEANNSRKAQYAPFLVNKGLMHNLSYAADACSKHMQNKSVNWPMVIYVIFVHSTALMGLLSLFTVSWKTQLWAFILWPISGLGITAGVHRLWAHRSYDAHWSVRLFLMLANSIANQVYIKLFES